MHFNIHRIFKIRSELEELYLNQVIQTFALSLVGIFIPIYLMEVGFNLEFALIFMLISYASVSLFSPVSAWTASRIGFKHTILSSIPFRISYLALLVFVSYMNPVFILLLGVIVGVSASLYWVPLNAEFIKHTDRIHEGDEISHLIAFPKLATLVAPVIAGLILKFLGFSTLFALAIILFVLSVVPLFMTNDYKSRFRFRLKDFTPRLNKYISAAFFLRGVLVMTELVIWPLFIFVEFSDFVSVGLAAALSGLGISLFTLVIGRISRKVDRKRMMKAGALGYAMVWLSRLFMTTVLEAFLLSFLGGMFLTIITIAVFSSFCDFARGRKILSRVVFRELWLNSGKILALFILLALFLPLNFIFIICFIVSVAFLFL